MPLGEFSTICYEFLSDFWRKSQNEQGGKKNGQKLGLRRSEGHLRRSEGCLATAKPRAKKLQRSCATPRRRHCS